MSPSHRREFALDPFQQRGVDVLNAGRSVVVAAPTGAGKTVVAEHAIDLAIERGTKAFYTTPIKALSNQKYHDFVARCGQENVGLLTGDTSVNGEAPIVVMTTEVLRNMLYAQSPTLRRLDFVVLDEVHYLQDQYRGTVWEEVMIHAPPEVRLVCLSATVSNADELTAWIATVRGPTELVVHQERPVDLTNLYMVGDKDGRDTHLVPTLVGGEPNTEGHRFTEDQAKRQRGPKTRNRRRYFTPRRLEVLETLEDRHMLPAIVFVFSRAGCDDAARQLIDDGALLTEPSEQAQIREIAEHHVRNLAATDRDVLRFDRFVRGLERGVATHHAGMVPSFKEVVEECFVRGLVKIVFATETLALGINMPARAVVIERMTKFNGDTHEFLTPLEYTQLTGRAGRRGIDDAGFAVVLWSPHVSFEQVAVLASSRAFALRSVFRPTYNMAVNLVRLHDRDGAHDLLDQSFGQFQADRDMTEMSKRRRRLMSELKQLESEVRADGIDPSATEPPGPTVLDADADVLSIQQALTRLRPGDIIATPNAGPNEPAVVLSVGYRSGGTVKVRLVSLSHRRTTVGLDDFSVAPDVLGAIVLPEPYQPNNGEFQHEVVRKLKRARLRKRTGPITQVSAAPVRADRRVRRISDKKRQLRRLEQRVEGRATRLARQFDDIVGILQMRGYIANWDVTESGQILQGIFHESDLAIAEAIRQGYFDDLSPPELAAVASCFTYEHRGSTPPPSPRLRSATLRERFRDLDKMVAELRDIEAGGGVRLTKELDAGFVATAAGWAGGSDLDDILGADDDLTGGDFVRQIRQLVDLLRQIGTVAPNRDTRSAAHSAADALHRGVVVASTAIEGLTSTDAAADDVERRDGTDDAVAR